MKRHAGAGRSEKAGIFCMTKFGDHESGVFELQTSRKLRLETSSEDKMNRLLLNTCYGIVEDQVGFNDLSIDCQSIVTNQCRIAGENARWGSSRTIWLCLDVILFFHAAFVVKCGVNFVSSASDKL